MPWKMRELPRLFLFKNLETIRSRGDYLLLIVGIGVLGIIRVLPRANWFSFAGTPNSYVPRQGPHPIDDGLIHGVSLKDGHVKVQIDMILDGFANIPLHVPVPAADTEKLQDAHMSFVQWPKSGMVLHEFARKVVILASNFLW